MDVAHGSDGTGRRARGRRGRAPGRPRAVGLVEREAAEGTLTSDHEHVHERHKRPRRHGDKHQVVLVRVALSQRGWSTGHGERGAGRRARALHGLAVRASSGEWRRLRRRPVHALEAGAQLASVSGARPSAGR
eukprot:3057927-Prymnesium_polylepis.1